MYAHACRKFPDLVPAIRALSTEDATFRCVLADYEEMCTWLAASRGAASVDAAELDHASEMIGNLEDEILAMLSKGDRR